MRSRKSVANWKRIYKPFKFKLLTIVPYSKEAYEDAPVWESFADGSNIAAQYDEQRHIFGDIDTLRPNRRMRRILKRTLSWRTPKGFCAVFTGPLEKRFYRAFYALRCADLVKDKKTGKWLWDQIIQKIRKSLASLGLSDDMALHGIFKDMDLLTYVLLVPSVTCRHQGRKGTPVRKHTSQIPYCNQSPDKKHFYVTRTFYNYTTELMNVNEFLRSVLK